MENDDEKLRKACRDIYHQSVEGLLSIDDTISLENTFMQTTGVYKYHELGTISNPTNSGRNVKRLQNIIENLCNGEHPANKEIKKFMLENGYIKENNGKIEFMPSFILQTPDNGLFGGCTKLDKNGNVLIIINEQQAQREDSSLAVVLGHEICHQMINEKTQNNGTSAEVEALCDLVGLVAAKGAGYDVRNKIAEDEKDYSRDTQKQIYEKFFSDRSPEEIEKMVDTHMENTVNTFYMPKKLKRVAEFVDRKVPLSTTMKNKRNAEQAKKRVMDKISSCHSNNNDNTPSKESVNSRNRTNVNMQLPLSTIIDTQKS